MLTTLSSRFHRPFWPVTFITGGLALLTLVVLLVVYGQTRQWQYLALAGIVAMISLAHGLAGWLASRRNRFDLGIWLIAAAQILSAVVAPLFMADYWLIGLFLLAAVPIEVGAADQLRRMPLFAVFSLLGAAGMVAIDLLALPTRLTILTDLPGAIFLAISFLILHLAGLTLLLWRLRLRPQASHHTRLDLATQQSLVFTGISAISIVVVTGVLIAQIRASQIEQVGQNFQTLAEINAERVGNSLEQQIAALLSLGRRETVLLEGLTAANAKYPESVVEIRQLLQEQEQRWQTSPENSDFILQYRSNPQTIELSKFRGADVLHNNVFLADRRGGLVAAQGEKPAKFFYGDEAWWQTAWNNSQGGVYLGQLTIDPTTRLASIFIAVNVLNPQTNQTVGVLASTYQLRSVQRDISVTSNQITGEVALLSADGIVIAGPDEAAIGQPVGPSLLTSGQGNEPQLTEPGWLLGTDGQGEPVVLAHALLNTSSGINLDPLRALGWQVVVSDTQVNALAGVTRSTKVATLVGLLAMALGVLAATATARVITRPIEALTTTAAAMSGGNLEQQAEPVGPVELVTLAEAFNTLTARLRSLINSLQDQVAQRTAQLEARVEQLATLNRITQTVASVRDLQAALEIVAREMVQLFKGRNSGIALLNAAQTELTVVAEYSRDPTEVNAVGTLIPLAGNPSSAHVVETGRSIVVPQAQINPLTKPIHELMLMRQIQCLLIVPLLARGEVIGTIGVATDEPNREFTSTEVTLAETVAGQIAGAIENARLFSEMEKAKEVAEAANEAKSAFLANVSHELRTPLTSVLGFAKIIQKRLVEVIFPKVQVNSESAEDGKTQRALRQVKENIGIIVSEGERLTTLINNVLDLAKIEAGKVEWQMQPLAVAEVIERAIAATSALFEQKQLELIKDVADNLPQVVGDYDRLIQVVINLISNAVKFTDHGSVTCQVRQVNGEIIISVTDTGIGIAEADQPKVFEKFIQVGNTLIDKPQGTGLGLTICKQIVEHHGGHIWLESKLGQGSTFSFTLSISTQERVLIAEEPPQPASTHL